MGQDLDDIDQNNADLRQHEQVIDGLFADEGYNDNDEDDDDDNSCFRCGREGHYASSCYASKHVNGYYLK